MRIIGGRFGGRRLAAPRGLTTRPMPDRVRQAIFDMLGARWGLPGNLPSIAVLDLFAGSGLLGLEALSRGAGFCCFVERDSRAVALLGGHVDELGVRDVAEIVAADILAGPALPVPPVDTGYSLVFVDPPYHLSRDSSATGPMGRLLEGLGRWVRLSPEALVVLRHERKYSYDIVAYECFGGFERREYGSMAVTIMSRAGE